MGHQSKGQSIDKTEQHGCMLWTCGASVVSFSLREVGIATEHSRQDHEDGVFRVWNTISEFARRMNLSNS